ncbi:MAG TPA: hypothetical protein VMV77_05170 [Bacteroidales bacterium]|nr:hypothetical protein [Bacteroidales bacterium]
MSEPKMTMLKPAPDKCQECAKDHRPDMPHDPNSLYYQMQFQMKHSRWPTWTDAMAHCSQEMKDIWIKALAEKGIDITKDAR